MAVDEWQKGFRTLEQDEHAPDRFMRTANFKSRNPRFKPSIRNFPLDQLHTNFANKNMGPGAYKTAPLPSFSFKLLDHEKRFCPSPHAPQTEWEKKTKTLDQPRTPKLHVMGL